MRTFSSCSAMPLSLKSTYTVSPSITLITLCSTDADTGMIDTVVSINAIAKIFFITVIIEQK